MYHQLYLHQLQRPISHKTHTHSSVARAASALLVRDAERSAAGPVDNGSILLHSLTAVAEEAAKKGTAGLLQVQAAAQTWTVLAGGALREEAGWNEAAVVGALEAEQAFLAEAFGLEPDAAAAGEDGDEREISNGDQRQPIQEEQERRRERVRRRLRAMGRRAAVGRASAESLLGRLFLRQCAVAEALRRLEGDGDSEWLERLVEGRMVGGEPEDDAEEALLRAMGVDVRGEAAALAAAWREKDDDGEGEQRLGRGERFDRPSASVVGDEDEEEEEECGGTSEGVGGEQGQAAVVFDSCGGDREECPDRGGSGSPTTSVESQQQEEDVLEVFEGTAKSPGWEEQQAAGDGRRQQQEEQHQQLQQGSLLFGELSRVLQGRQQRGQGKIVKVRKALRVGCGYGQEVNRLIPLSLTPISTIQHE